MIGAVGRQRGVLVVDVDDRHVFLLAAVSQLVARNVEVDGEDAGRLRQDERANREDERGAVLVGEVWLVER